MSETKPTTLRRELGTIESYAILIGILVGAGIFAVTADAGAIAGPSVILGYLTLAPVVMATAVAYLVFLTTSLGLQPGGEVLHIERTFQNGTLTFVSAWLKCVSYLGAAAYLADALALNFEKLFEAQLEPTPHMLLALGMIAFFWFVHTRSVLWFGRLQVAMCAVLGLALVVLIVPGLFAVEAKNLEPFFTGGWSGFATALPMLFFAYAGFESLAHSAGEVRDSQRNLPKVFVRGILITTVIFAAMSVVAFGVLPAGVVGSTRVPMSEAAAVYLPVGARELVTIGAIMAIATSLNATLLVPARLAWSMAQVGKLPRAFGRVHPKRQIPVFGVTVSALLVAILAWSGKRHLALAIATSALIALYVIHSIALLALPRRNPQLFAEVKTRLSRKWQVLAAWLSVASLTTVLVIQFGGDVAKRCRAPLAEDLTTLELLLLWIALGLVLARTSRRSPA
ncbi:MAG: APA family basic amino acid/polyamine antiporter [Planctomycetota bacterium]